MSTVLGFIGTSPSSGFYGGLSKGVYQLDEVTPIAVTFDVWVTDTSDNVVDDLGNMLLFRV